MTIAHKENDMRLKGKKVAVLVADFYQPLEYWYPFCRLQEEGAEVRQISRGERHRTRHGYESAKRDVLPKDALHTDFDAVVIPGGYAPDAMRDDPELVRFVREMDKAGKLVAAICHGPWVPMTAGITKGRTMTCYPSIRVDATNAGAEYVDRDAVRDRNLVTSRTPEDLPAFVREIVTTLSDRPADMELRGRTIAL